jgi:hypothetical protein
MAVIAAVGAGCATAPVSNGPQPLPGSSGEPQAFVQPVPPPPPGHLWSPAEVVLGFVHASASFALDPGAARAYLASGTAWRPTGSSVTVVGPGFTTVPRFVGKHGQGVQQAWVTLRGERIAELSGTGQYSYQPSATAAQFTFELVSQGGRWLISSLPAGTQLLLTQSDFQQVFEPRNLYFFSQQLPDYLIPDPVYVPVQGTNGSLSTYLAGGLVQGLIAGGGSWQSDVTTTAFPAKTRLLGPVVISNQTALVNLGGAAARATLEKREEMYAQLWQTLTSSVYSPPVATNVQLAINGQIQNLPRLDDDVPGVAGLAGSGQPLYFAADGAVRELSPANHLGTLLPLGSRSAVTAMAATTSAGGERFVAAAIPRGNGCAVDVATATGLTGRYPISATGGPCVSLSWDSGGLLWIVSRTGIWKLQLGATPVQVSEPSLPPGARILGLQMAPDGIRAALLVQIGMHRELYIAALKSSTGGDSFGSTVPVGTGLPIPGPSAFSWSGPYYLLAIDGTTLYQVPLIGPSAPQSSALPGDVVSLSAAGSDSVTPTELAVGTGSGRIFKSTYPFIGWALAPEPGSSPVLPG